MTRIDAASAFRAALPSDLGFRALTRDVDDSDLDAGRVVIWSVDIFDENDESVGTATMLEHWPEVEIHWA